MEKQITSHAFKGLLIALVLIVLSLIGQFANLQFERWYGYVNWAIMVGAFIWSAIYFGKQMDNNVTFGSLFTHGFKTTAVTAVVVFIYTVLSVYVIFPDQLDKMWEKGVEEAMKGGKVTAEQMEQGASIGRKVMTVTVLAGSLIGTLIIGTVGSLIGAGVAKKNPAPTPFEQQ
jgi:hypothetical protein